MRNRPWFKSEAEWTALAHYLMPALGLLGLLAASVVARLGAGR